MKRNYLTAIIICIRDGRPVGLKYHDIKNASHKIDAFLKFARKQPGAKHVNFYFKCENVGEKGKNWAFRHYL
jgi:hypothetical protein